MKLEKIGYQDLKGSIAKRNYNFAKLSSILADYGYATIRLTDDYSGADLTDDYLGAALLAVHHNKDNESIIPIQLTTRFGIYKKYLEYPKLYIAAPIGGLWYCYPHREIVDKLEARGDIYVNTHSWQKEGGGYSAPSLGDEVLELLKPYRLDAEELV